ncbi:hypothetical protein Pse7367_3948 (plasmid) [Thalassoporum mexicanum PCC 7367]|uniref:hypothetical protein n=1 Tax=Thalassoporum mexicanum TaxID=3457544 RepID=UPI00029FF062|nr:hypothetical protein [Pseudanabaena sp. PCC 7367]AFY72163.1 hypothetical protein Pse7367_3948 [Pseudanabaena sp. PCC 7367]
MAEFDKKRADLILDSISETGSDDKACKEARIDKKTFHQWLRNEISFSEQVAKARHIYREGKNHSQVVKAMAVLDQYLGGEATEVHNSEEERIGSNKETSHKKSTKQVRRSTPAWVIDRVLGKRMHEMEALRVLANAGWVPRTILTEVVGGIAVLRESVRHAFDNLSSSNRDSSKN